MTNGEQKRRDLQEMSDTMFVAALNCAVNPMDEELMRQLCLEAAQRIRHPERRMMEKLATILESQEAMMGSFLFQQKMISSLIQTNKSEDTK